MTTTQPAISDAGNLDTLLRWINRSIECLWLLAVFLVPLAFLDREYVISEAVIAYVEVPKIALMRTLAGLIAILWLLEWGIAGRQNPLPSWMTDIGQFRPRGLFAKLGGWLRGQPTRWIWLAVWFYFATFLMGTIFSASFSVSLWGEVPGQDGYSAYTITGYGVLFGVIATHLKTRPQLWRLLGAITAMGVLASGYSVLEHHGHDFLNLTEFTGGGGAESRTTSSMGNSIFAAAVMSMTIPISLFLAAVSLGGMEVSGSKIKANLGRWTQTFAVASVWVLILSIQLMGITYTFSRGPWMGAILALLATGVMTAVFAGWGALGRIAVLLGVATGATLAVVQWDISVSNILLWLGSALTMAGLIAIAAVLGWRIIGRVSLALGVAAILGGTVILIPSWFGDGLESVDSQSSSAAQPTSLAERGVASRFSSIRGTVKSGILGGRVDTWQRSWLMIRDRPWFEFDELSSAWIRPWLGYGPDLFRYTYLLNSVPQGGNAPVEPDHAHNYFINHAVELGIFGFLSSLGIFAAVFLVGAYFLIWQRNGVSPLLTLVLIGVLATLAGRFLEMMVGVARISDLTILWVVFGMAAALPTVMSRSSGEPSPPSPRQGSRRRSRTPNRSSQSVFVFKWPWFIRLAIVAWLIGGIGILIWVKNVNYVRASVEVGEAVQQFRTGDFQASLASLDKAIELAPDVSTYYNYRAQIYFAYNQVDKVTPERECSLQGAIPYVGCLNLKSFESNIEGANQRPFYYRSRLALANSALNLKQDAIAIQLYTQVLSMVPNSVPLRNEIGKTFIDLGDAYVEADKLDRALMPLLQTDGILIDEVLLARARFSTGVAHRALGSLTEAAESFELSLATPFAQGSLGRGHKALADIYGELEQPDLAAKHRALAEQIALDLLAQGEAERLDRRAGQAQETLEDALEISTLDDTLVRIHQEMIDVSTYREDDDSLVKHQSLLEELSEDIFQRGMAARDDGQLQQAAESLALSFQFTRNLQLKGQAHTVLLELFHQLGASRLSEEHLSRAEKVAVTLVDDGKIQQENNQLRQAADSFELSLKLTADPALNLVAHNRLGTIYQQRIQALPKPDASLPEGVWPDQTRDHLASVEQAALDLLDQGKAADRLQEYQQAREAYDLALQLSAVEGTIVKAHQLLISVSQKLGDENASIMHRNRVQQLAAEAFQRGISARDSGRLQQAAADLALAFEFPLIPNSEEMSKLFPDQLIATKLQIHQALTEIFTQIGPSELSQRHQVLALGTAQTLVETGIFQQRKGPLQQAAYSFESGLALTDRLDPQAHGWLVSIYSELGQSALADKHRELAQP